MTTTPMRPQAPRYLTRTVIGYPHEIARIVTANQRTGRLVSASGPVPAPDGSGRVIVALRLRAPAGPVVTRPAPRPAPVPSRVRMQRPGRTVAIAAAVGVGVATVAGVALWLAVRLVLGLLGVLAGNGYLFVGIGVVALVLAAGVAHRCCCPTCGR